MGTRRIAISLILVVFLTGEVYSKLSSDQYKQQAEPDPVHNKKDEQKTSSLHKVELTSTGLHSVTLLPQQTNLDRRKPKLAELQIGCADGSVQNGDQQIKKQKRHIKSFDNVIQFLKLRSKRETEAPDMIKQFDNHDLVEEIQPEVKTRSKRYFPWFGNTGFGFPNAGFYSSPVPSTPFQYPGSVTGFSHTLSHSHYNLPSTPSYQIVIPLFSGQIPILFPPRPVIFNPGYPPHNRPRPRPERPTTQQNDTVPMITDTRFGDPNGDLDDHPVWGIVDSQEDIFGGGSPATTRRPTGATKPPTPPLFHRPSFGDEGEGNIPMDVNNVFNSNRITTTTRRPLRPKPTTQRPTTYRPQTQRTTTEASERQLPRCTWAIITCCNPTNDQLVSSECFENAGCGSSFWGQSPCSKESTLEALDAAQRFYESQ